MAEVTPVNKSAQVTLDGSGNGRVSLGPDHYSQTWTDVLAAVSVSTTVLQAQCSLYIGSVSPGNLLDVTETGSSGDRSGCPYPLTPGSPIVAVWTGGDAGAVATLSLFGTQTVGSA